MSDALGVSVGLQCKWDVWGDRPDDWDDSGRDRRQPEGARMPGAERRQKVWRRAAGVAPRNLPPALRAFIIRISTNLNLKMMCCENFSHHLKVTRIH